MWRFLFPGIGLLAVLYGVKVAIVHLSMPLQPPVEEDELASLTIVTEPDTSIGVVLRAGQDALRQGDDAKALEIYQTCIDEGNTTLEKAACQSALGELHLLGVGVPRNFTKAVALFDEAAVVGDADAQYNLGIIYGATYVPEDGLQRREALAVLNLYAASTTGHTGALMAMGYRHMQGYGVPQSCSTAALNYIDVAKRIASVYSEGMPQAVELIRLNLHHKDRKVISSSEMNLFVQIATSGDATIAAAIGKRYLLGIEGFKQDYLKAKHYLRLAGGQNHAGAMALLGYMYCLGLGTAQNLDTAYTYFVSAATQNEPLGHNGLGFIYFRGSSAQAKNVRLAFKHFNESAFGGSSDGMFNLASMYLTGTGTEQSFQKAVLYYTQALDRGHTPAAYSLAVMHLNGIGTVRDCDIAVNLLKKVCERGEWVSSKLVDAYEYSEKQPDKAAWLYVKLAEAGHEVAQMNAAHLYDTGQSTILYPHGPAAADESDDALAEDVRHHSKTLGQRFYEMSAAQGSASSELRLGDYSYYGWGVSASFKEVERDSVPEPVMADGEEDDGMPNLYSDTEVELQPQTVDYGASLARYQKTAEMTVTGEWMQGFVARGSFNLGFMHQFGLGVDQDLHTAKQHYHRCREVDPNGLHTPVTMVLLFLAAHMLFLRSPTWDVLVSRLFADIRTHLLLILLSSLCFLLYVRLQLVSRNTQIEALERRLAESASDEPEAPADTASVSAAGISPSFASSVGGSGDPGAGELRRRNV